jgi:hypothetical protein
VINPLAVGVTIGGLLLDVVVPRPKPRVGPLPVVAHWSEDTAVYTRGVRASAGRERVLSSSESW